MKHQNFVYKIRSRYIILHTHKQTITKFFFSEEKIQKFYLALAIHSRGPGTIFTWGGANNKKSENLRFFKFLLYKSPIQGGLPLPSPAPLFRGPYIWGK